MTHPARREFVVTGDPAPQLIYETHSNGLPDGAAYWNNAADSYEPADCDCAVPVIGEKGAFGRWTCRTCHKRVARRTLKWDGNDSPPLSKRQRKQKEAS